jgi:hypothetical protein
MSTLKEVEEHARTEASRRGFRSLGIYHLIWSVHKLQPDDLDEILRRYQVEKVPFIKMLENILRPRRAGGGIPRDRLDASLAEDALERAEKLDDQPEAVHLLQVLPDLDEDPIASLCDRFALNCTPPETETGTG